MQPCSTCVSDHPPPRHCSSPLGPSEYVKGLTYEEAATLLNVDVKNEELMGQIYDTAFAIKVGGWVGAADLLRVWSGEGQVSVVGLGGGTRS